MQSFRLVLSKRQIDCIVNRDHKPIANTIQMFLPAVKNIDICSAQADSCRVTIPYGEVSKLAWGRFKIGLETKSLALHLTQIHSVQPAASKTLLIRPSTHDVDVKGGLHHIQCLQQIVWLPALQFQEQL